MAHWSREDLEALYVRLEKPLFNVVYRRVWDPEEARDLVQEAFVRLWGMRRKVVPDTVEPLVYRIALNLVASRARRRRLRRFLGLEESATPPLRDATDTEAAFAAAEERARLRAAIDGLPADVRDVLLLSVFGELSYAEIARSLNIPEGTVGSRRNRAVRRLRAELTGRLQAREQ